MRPSLARRDSARESPSTERDCQAHGSYSRLSLGPHQHFSASLVCSIYTAALLSVCLSVCVFVPAWLQRLWATEKQGPGISGNRNTTQKFLFLFLIQAVSSPLRMRATLDDTIRYGDHVSGNNEFPPLFFILFHFVVIIFIFRWPGIIRTVMQSPN